MLECPACKTSYKEEVNTCKKCNLLEKDIHHIKEIKQNNPIFSCISFLISSLNKTQKTNNENQIRLNISQLEIKVQKVITDQQQDRQKVEQLDKKLLELESQRRSKDNQNIDLDLDTQTESEVSINSQSANSIEDNSNNYDSQNSCNTKEDHGNDDKIVASQNEKSFNNNHNDSFNFNETDKSNVLQITDAQIPQFIETYNTDKNSFDENSGTRVGETQESSDNRLAGRSEEVFLSSTSKGNYWIIEENNNFYLVPHAKISINEHNKRYTIENLFECNESSSDDYNFKLIQPAKVVKEDSELWRLEKKGKLEFY